MKSAHRHDLETNTLAKGLGAWGEKIQPYSSALLAVVAALVAIYFILSVWSSYSAGRDRAAWDEYQMAILDGDGELKQLQAVAASDENASALKMQDWAYVTWADRQLRIASDQYFTDRTGADKRLSAIVAVYENFSANASDPEVRNRARLGLARVDELQNRLDDARKHYALVEGALSTVAAARMKELESKPVQDAAQWLATAKAPAPKMPSGAGTAGARPGFGAQPPAAEAPPAGIEPSRSFEDIFGGLKKDKDEPARYNEEPAEGKADEAKPPAEATAPGEAAPAAGSAAPAEAPASTETPATTETPAPAEPAEPAPQPAPPAPQ